MSLRRHYLSMWKAGYRGMQIVKSAKPLPEKRVSSAEKTDLEAFVRWVREREAGTGATDAIFRRMG